MAARKSLMYGIYGGYQKYAGKTWKPTTALTGIPVSENPHQELKVLYDKIQKALQKVPETAAYRINTEKIIKYRLELINSEPDCAQLEKKIGMGQLEEVILQAKHEVDAARSFAKSKAWEPLKEKAPEDQWRWPVYALRATVRTLFIAVV